MWILLGAYWPGNLTLRRVIGLGWRRQVKNLAINTKYNLLLRYKFHTFQSHAYKSCNLLSQNGTNLPSIVSWRLKDRHMRIQFPFEYYLWSHVELCTTLHVHCLRMNDDAVWSKVDRLSPEPVSLQTTGQSAKTLGSWSALISFLQWCRLLTNTFLGFRSRCTISFEWRKQRPFATSFAAFGKTSKKCSKASVWPSMWPRVFKNFNKLDIWWLRPKGLKSKHS